MLNLKFNGNIVSIDKLHVCLKLKLLFELLQKNNEEVNDLGPRMHNTTVVVPVDTENTEKDLHEPPPAPVYADKYGSLFG